MLLYFALTFVRKPIIYDELINFTEWMDEHGRIEPGTLSYRFFRGWYASLAKRCRFILADTDAHAAYSAQLNHLDQAIYKTLPVCADETVFKPLEAAREQQAFEVLYYGSMLPLHGLAFVLEAAVKLKHHPNIKFRIVGGKNDVSQACDRAVKQGANIQYQSWVPFEALPNLLSTASLAMGGPFGNTLQSNYVVTGKTYQFLASAKPTLIGENLVTEEFINEVNCLKIPQGDADAIAAAVLSAYENPKILEKIGLAGRELYDAHFSQTVVNGKVARIVNELR
jgi:glycosyltransferase involved in cell wall biosynthesis